MFPNSIISRNIGLIYDSNGLSDEVQHKIFAKLALSPPPTVGLEILVLKSEDTV
jgi:hypothetical protein